MYEEELAEIISYEKVGCMFSRIKNWIGIRKANNIEHLLPKENKNEGYILDFSSHIVIKLPQIEKPNFEEDRKPRKYWEIYNRGVSFYEKKMYEQSVNR